MKQTKLAYHIAGGLLFASVTATILFIALFIGFWLTILTGIFGAIVGGNIYKKKGFTMDDIPADWFEDVGPTEGTNKSTKH